MLRNLIVASLFVIAVVRPVRGEPIDFAFGMSSSITVPANERVELPAVLANTGTDPLVFDDVGFNLGMSAGGPGEGLNDLNLEFDTAEFAGVTIPIGQLFTFTFVSILFEPSLFTELHPIASFAIPTDVIGNKVILMRAHIPLTIGIGPQTEFGPLLFVPAVKDVSPIPEPSTLLLLLAGGAVAAMRSSVRKRTCGFPMS